MNDIIVRIVLAIIRQEGMPADYPNPGNLRGAPWLPGKQPMTTSGFWFPASRAWGVAGLQHVVALHIAEGQSLTQFITGYAPPGDHNNTAAYIGNVANWAQIPDVNAPLMQYLGV